MAPTPLGAVVVGRRRRMPDPHPNGDAPFPPRRFAVETDVVAAPRRPEPVEWRHCQTTHYVARRPLPLGEPIPPDAVVVVCGRCPVPRRGLALRCCACGAPLEPQQGGRTLRRA